MAPQGDLSPVRKFLTGEKWALFVFICITIPLMVHTGHLIVQASGIEFGLFPGDELLYAVFFAIGFDMAILTLAIRGKGTDFSVITFLIFLFNAFFLNIHFIEALPQPWPELMMFSIRLVIAGAATWLVHAYVSFYVKSGSDQDAVWALYKQIEELKAQVNSATAALNEERNNNRKLFEEKTSIAADLRVAQAILPTEEEERDSNVVVAAPKAVNEAPSLRCICGKKVTSEKGLSAHIRTCTVAQAAGITTLDQALVFMSTKQPLSGQRQPMTVSA